MDGARISRRGALVGGAAAALGVAAGAVPAAAAGAPEPARSAAQQPHPSQARAAGPHALPALGQREQSVYCMGPMLTVSSASAGASNVLVWTLGGNYASSGWIGMPVLVPVGSLVTAADVILSGTPTAGIAFCDLWAPAGAGFVETVAQASATGVTGRETLSLAINHRQGATDALEVYVGLTSASAVVCGIRVRYVPPNFGFVPVTPTRVYDSRGRMAPTPSGPLAGGQHRTVPVANGRNSAGATTVANLVPANAVAVAYTVTAAATVGSGFLTVNPGGTTDVTSSVVNWTTNGQNVANTSSVGLGPNRTITVVAGGGRTQFLIDVVGYFLP